MSGRQVMRLTTKLEEIRYPIQLPNVPSSARPWASSQSLLRYRDFWNYAINGSYFGSMRRPTTFGMQDHQLLRDSHQLLPSCKGS